MTQYRKQHLLSRVMVIGMVFGMAFTAVTAGGCASRPKKMSTADTPMPVPSNSYMRVWPNDLKLGAKDSVSQLYMREDLLFVYTKNDLVYAIGRSGGDLKYLAEPEVSGGILRPPLLLGDRVIFPSGSTIDVFNSRGRAVRTIALEKPTRSGATGAGDTVYIGLDHTGGTGVLASVDITKPYHVVNWESMTYGAIDATPAIFDKIIYFGSEDGRLYAVTEERGAVWPLPNGALQTSGKFLADIVADDFGVYASNTDSKLYCLDRVNAKIKWQYYASAPLRTAPVVTATMVYQYVPGSGIVALDKTTGQFNRAPKWMAKSAVQVLSEDPNYVYLRRRDNLLMAVEKASGQVAFTSKKHPFDVFATNTKDEMIYGATRGGAVWAVRPMLKEGEVGNIVMDLRFEPVALAR